MVRNNLESCEKDIFEQVPDMVVKKVADFVVYNPKVSLHGPQRTKDQTKPS